MFIFPMSMRDVYLVDLNPLSESNCSGLFKFVELQEYFKDRMLKLFLDALKNEDTVIGFCERNFLPVDLLNSSSDINNIDFNNLPQ